MPNFSEEDQVGLMEEAYEIEEIRPPERNPRSKKSASPSWRPNVGPIGMAILQSSVRNILLHGERGSTKTNISIHKLILAMYENWNNLGLLFMMFRSAATEGGAWEKLLTYNLPEWYDGIGLDFSEPKMDDQKNRHIFIGNQYGKWSRIVLKSMPPGSDITSKMRGPEPGFVFFDEIALSDDPNYFFKIDQQLRRPKIPNPQFLMACNPPDSGEEHWLYKLFFTGPQEDPEKAKIFKQIHVPISENVFWTEIQKKEYQDKLRQEALINNDPTVVDRMVDGQWVARATGDGLFSDVFYENKHVVGNAIKGEGLLPHDGYPVGISYDPGNVNSSITIFQLILVKDRIWWLWLDDIDHIGEKVHFKKLALEVIDRMKFWREICKFNFHYSHYADEAAISQYRAGTGRHDAKEFEDAYNEVAKENGFKPDEGHEKVRLIGCPKGDGSVEARVHMTRQELVEGTTYISATARHSIKMFKHLPEDPKHPGKPLKTSRFRHKFDSGTYGRYYWKFRGHKNFLRTGSSGSPIIRVGRGGS